LFSHIFINKNPLWGIPVPAPERINPAGGNRFIVLYSPRKIAVLTFQNLLNNFISETLSCQTVNSNNLLITLSAIKGEFPRPNSSRPSGRITGLIRKRVNSYQWLADYLAYRLAEKTEKR
jgi:hypothetical protein